MNFKQLSLADLVSLYNNYLLVERSGLQIGAAGRILDDDEFEQVQEEIEKRMEKLRR